MKLDKEEILYIESRQRKAVIHTTQKVLEIYATMNGLEKELGKPFYRCHRGYLVNLSRISGYTGDSITLCNGETIYLAREKSGMVLWQLSGKAVQKREMDGMCGYFRLSGNEKSLENDFRGRL